MCDLANYSKIEDFSLIVYKVKVMEKSIGNTDRKKAEYC